MAICGACICQFLSNVSAFLLLFDVCLMRLACATRVLVVGSVCLVILDECISVLACFLNVSRVYLICHTSISSFSCKNNWKTQVFAYFSCVPLHPFGSCWKAGRLLLSTVTWFWHIFLDFLYPFKKSWKTNSFARFCKTLQNDWFFSTFWIGKGNLRKCFKTM